MTGFVPGDVIIDRLIIQGTKGIVDLTQAFSTAAVFESIYTAGVAAQITVIDQNDYIGNQSIQGGEIVIFTFTTPGGKTLTYNMILNSVTDVQNTPSMRAKSYMLSCLSPEGFTNKTNIVQKSYNTQISNMVSDLYRNFLRGQRPLQLEPTQGIQQIIIPNLKPLAAIDMVRRRATSSANRSSTYLFYENQFGFHFVTLESRFRRGILKRFKQDNTVGSDLRISTHDNILAWRAEHQNSATRRVGSGGMRQDIITFDFETLQFRRRGQNVDLASFATGGSRGLDSTLLRNIFGQRSGRDAFLPTDSRLPRTNIPETTAGQRSYASAMGSGWVEITVPGDTYLTAGEMVEANILRRSADDQSAGQLDLAVSGKHLISRIRHNIGLPQNRPRYTCVLELLKGAYDQ